MDCGQCGEANRDAARFCDECGAPLPRRCTSCKAELRPTAKFCDECGTPTGDSPTPSTSGPTPGPEATRKTVTALFADLVGSTSFGERADAEVARAVMARYHALLQDAIDAHGGTVAKFMGDGMMATFGIPEIAEDDAVRAVNAGLDIQRRFTEFAADVMRQHGETLGLRVGVNTGEVVIASGDADLVGDALNVAARIEHACNPGRVTVGEETWRLTRGEFGYDSLGEVSVAGRAQPVAIYEVVADAAATAETAAPFVGRVSEIITLRAAFDAAVEARAARLVTVLGSPGVGKTRLSRELGAALAADANAITVELRCDRAGDATFAPIAQLIRTLANLSDDADTDAEAVRGRLGTLLADDEPDRERLIDVYAGLVGTAPSRSVEETFWGIRRLVSASSGGRPTVVVIDDIQWAEPLLLDLLEHLAEWVQDVPLLIMCLARPELRDVRPSLAEPGRRLEAVLALDGLDAAATEALAAGLLGTDRLPAGLVARLPASTDGNPLFVRELVRMLVDDQVIRRNGNEWELAIDAEAVEVPPTIQSLLAARVERLPGDERAVLELASVIGAEFNLGALRELAGDRTPLPALLESMRRKELVEPTGTYWGDEPVHRFHHVLIRDAAYRRLLKTTRADLHEKVAVWTDHAAEHLIGEHEAVIAFHYEQAHRYRDELGTVDEHVINLGRRATELLSVAADRALGRDDLAAAGTLTRRAVALLPQSDVADRAQLLLTACECTLASGDIAAGRPAVEQLRAAAGADPTLGAWASCFEAQLVGLTDPEGLVGAEATATGASKVMEELGDGAGEAKAHQVRAELLARLGRVGDAELELDLALGAARRVDDRRRVTAVLGAAPPAALWGPSPVARAGGRCLDVVRLLRITTASPSVEATSMRCQAVLEALRGRFDVARSMLDSSRTTLEELGLRHGLLETAYLAGVVELVADDAAAAIGPLRDAYDGLIEMGVGIDAGRAAALLAHALVAEGRVDDAEPVAAASEELAGQDLKTAIAWRVARAEVRASRGDAPGGIALATEAVEIAAATDLVIDHADACVTLAALHEQTGDTTAAHSARAEAKRLYALKGATVPAGRLTEEPTPERADPATPAPVPLTPVSDSRPGSDPAETRSPDAVNAAVFVTVEIGARLGRWSEIPDRFSPDATVHDRRRLVGSPRRSGRDEMLAMDQAFGAVGFDTPNEHARVLAVRGDRLALVSGGTTTGDGLEAVFVTLVEIDDERRVAALDFFDEKDLAGAIDELDARYLAGEGAPHAQVLRIVGSMRDPRKLDDLVSPDFVAVDHQRIGHGEVDRDYLRASVEALDEQFTSRREIFRTVHISGDAVLAVRDDLKITEDGGTYTWTGVFVAAIDATGRVARLEIFDLDDFPAALARLDELGSAEPADPRNPRAENRASHILARYERLVSEGRYDEAAALYDDDMVATDRRFGVSIPPLRAAELRQALSHSFELFDEFDSVNLAVRGERLVLSNLTLRTHDGLEVPFLQLFEIDSSDRIRSTTQFDEDALADAVEELDARYLALEDRPFNHAVSTMGAGFAATNRRDWANLPDLYAPDFALVDHRQLGWPTVDAAGLIAMMQGYVELAPDLFLLTRTYQGSGRAALVTIDGSGTTEDGTVVEWVTHYVGTVNADGPSLAELYNDEDWDTALARLDELGAAEPADARHARADNTASRVTREYCDAWSPNGFADLVHRYTSPDIVRVDHRSVVAAPEAVGRDAFTESVRSLAAVGYTTTTFEPIAVRGERLCLGVNTYRNDEGFATAQLAIVEIDDDGRMIFIGDYDEADLASAVDALDARFIGGEGAVHAAVVRPSMDYIAAFNQRDWEALLATMHAHAVIGDHRGLWPQTSDRNAVLARMQSLAETSPDSVVISRRFLVAGEASLATYSAHGTSEHGDRYEYSFHVPATVVDGRFTVFEFFDEDDFAAALARFESLAASGRRSTPGLRNTVTDTVERYIERCATGEFGLDGIGAEDLVRYDRRRGVSTPTLNGLDEFEANMRAIFEVFDTFTSEPVAIRGDRVALVRVHLAREGFATSMLGVYEADERGLLARGTSFDEDDLHLALDELDERYIAGEGADDAYAILRAGDVRRSAHATDHPAAYKALHAADCVVMDHRLLSWPTETVSDVVDQIRADRGISAPRITVFTTLDVLGDAVLITMHDHFITPEGSEYLKRSLVVTRSVVGLVDSIDYFEPEQHPAAHARFEKLGAETRTPYVDNTIVRTMVRARWLSAIGDFDRAGKDHIAEDVERIDARHGVSAPTLHGRDEFVDFIRATFEVFDDIDFEWLAVRGDQLALARLLTTSADGFETTGLAIYESDESGYMARMVLLDDEDLDAAYDALEARYVEIRADAPGPVERAGAAQSDALRRGDRDAAGQCFAPDFVTVDHRTLGFGTATREEFLERRRAMAESTPDASLWFTKLYTQGHAGIVMVHLTGTTPEGSEYDWHYVNVVLADDQDRITRMEYFPEDRWTDALARFDELAGAGRSTTRPREPANRITQTFREALAGVGDGVAGIIGLVADDVVIRDRRVGVSAGTITGLEGFVANAGAHREVFARVRTSVLAVRGDRVALMILEFENDGFLSTRLNLLEANDSGHLVALGVFDEQDFELALEELEGRAAALAPPDERYMIERIYDVRRAASLPGHDAYRALMSPDFVLADHRTLGYGSVDLAELTALQEVRDEQVTDDRKFHRTREIKGDTVLAWYETHASAPDGGEYVWSHWVIWHWVGGLWSRLEMFDLDDEAAARARFEELAAETRTPHIENEVVRRYERYLWLSEFDETDDPTESMAPDLVIDDRRTGVSLGTLHGVDAAVENMKAQDQLFGPTTFVPIAVRGEHLALFRTRAVSDSGFELVSNGIFETNDAGQSRIMTFFDDDDLARALAALDARYSELCSLSPSEATLLAGTDALNRQDWDRFTAMFHPDFVAVDHSPLGFPETDRGGFVADQMQSMAALVPDFVAVLGKIYSQGRATLTRGTTFGTTVEGNEYQWDFLQVFLAASDGRGLRRELFAVEQWAEALARFDELATESDEPSSLTNGMWERSVARNDALDRGDRDAVLDTYAPDFVRTDRRRGVNFGTSNREETVDALLAGNDVGLGNRVATPVEVLGDNLALVEFRMSHDDGFEVVYLLALEDDDNGLLRRATNFDLEDRATASALLHLWAAERGEHKDAPANSLTREIRDFPTHFASGDLDTMAEMYAEPEMIVDDRRSGVSAGVVTGRDEVMGRLVRGLSDVGFRTVTSVPIAVRGDGLALFHRVWRDADGLDLPMLVLLEAGPSGRVGYQIMWSVEDFDAAVAELDRRARPTSA